MATKTLKRLTFTLKIGQLNVYGNGDPVRRLRRGRVVNVDLRYAKKIEN